MEPPTADAAPSTTASDAHAAARGAAIYSPATLYVYDLVVHGISNRFAWRCPTRTLCELYAHHVAEPHLDVGVGSGYFLDRCRFPAVRPRIALVDLNPSALEFTSRRIRRHQPVTYQANVLEPFRIDAGPFRSIALMYLLHCLPGSLKTKARVFDHVARHLVPGGTVFGATILGVGVEHSPAASALMRLYNTRGIFSNAEDSLEQLEAALENRFEEHTIRVHGSVALFEARHYRPG